MESGVQQHGAAVRPVGRRALTRSIAEGLGTPGLRRLQTSAALTALGSWAFFVALAVYSYHAGGATAVGAAAVVRMVPAGLAAPLTGLLADRRARRDVLIGSTLARAVTAGGISVAVAVDAPFGVVLGLAAVLTIVTTAQKPAQAALLLEVAAAPTQAAAAGTLWTGIDSAGFLAGSLLGGLLVATVGVGAVFAAIGAISLVAALPLLALPRNPVPGYRRAEASGDRVRALIGGLVHVARERDVRDVVGFLTAATLVEGAVDVLVVVLAISSLGLGQAGVGWLNAAWGLGGLAGGAVALGMLGRGRLSAGIAVGGVLVGTSLVLVALAPVTVLAVILLVLLGVGYALIEAASVTLLQRHTSDEVLARAFAVVESGYWLSTGLGAILAPLVLSMLGTRGALAAVGASLPLLVALRWRGLARFEAQATVPEAEFVALRGLDMFAPLPIATVENLARRTVRRDVGAGEVVIRCGEEGDALYVVADGALTVSECPGVPPVLRPGDVFGEIALLRSVPRTATVTARSVAILYALERDAFLCAVGGHPHTARVAHELAAARLRGQPTGTAA